MARKKAAVPKRDVPKKILAKDINFFDTREPKVYNKKTANRNAILFFLFFISVFAIAYPTIRTYYRNRTLETEIAQLQTTLSSKSVTAETGAVQEKSSALKQADLYTDATKAAAEEFDAFPKADPAIMDLIYGRLADGVSVDSLDYSDGVYTVACLADSVTAPPQSVKNLLGSGAFELVKYSGLSAAGAFGEYEFSVVCTVKEGAE